MSRSASPAARFLAVGIAMVSLGGCGSGASPPAAPAPPTPLTASPPKRPGVYFFRAPTRLIDERTVEFGRPPDCGCSGHGGLGVSVLLPRRYDGKRRFPILYLLHGAGDAHDSWLTRPTVRNGGLGGDLRRLARGYPAIVVMPEGGAFGWYSNWWNGGRLGNPAWETYHLDELIPRIERTLRVRPGRRWHAIAGWSMGGTGALLYAALRPGYFGAAASLSGRIAIRSPSFLRTLSPDDPRRTNVWGDPVRQAFYWAGHDPTSLVENLKYTDVYLHVGDGIGHGAAAGSQNAMIERELRTEADTFAEAARRTGGSFLLQAVAGLHDAANERAGLRKALGWLRFSPVTADPTTWTYRTIARTGTAWGIRFELDRQPTRLLTLRRQGSRLEADGVGNLTLTLPGGRTSTAKLPFSRQL